MNRRSIFVLLGCALAGCASTTIGSRPPESQVRVDQAYVADPAAPPRLAVVLGPVAVTDSVGVARHVGGTPGDAASTYRAFFAERLASAVFEGAHVGEVRVLEPAAYARDGAGPRPADGARLSFDDFEPDLVLLLDTLHVRRTSYIFVGLNGPDNDENLRLDTRVVLWDNEGGREVASGPLETERGLNKMSGRATRGSYEAAVGEFVEQLARYTPIDLRTEVQRRARRG